MSVETLLLAPGVTITVKEEDYCWGRGTLRLYVIEILGFARTPNGDWVSLRGRELEEGGYMLAERKVFVRVEGLLRQLPLPLNIGFPSPERRPRTEGHSTQF